MGRHRSRPPVRQVKPRPDPNLPLYERLAAGRNPLHELSRIFAPRLVGLTEAKKALLLSLFSTDDTSTSRGRVHVIFSGPPGGAKSSLIEAAARDCGIEVLSSRMSPGSLTIDFRNRKIGALGQAHDSEFQVFAVDEFEKVPPESLRHFLRSMEEGAFAVPGDEDEPQVIPAHWRLIAAANDLSPLPPELIDRFDFKIYIPLPTKPEAHRVVRGIAQSFMQPVAAIEGIPENFIRGYLRWSRTFVPEFGESERALAARIFEMMVDSELDDKVHLRPYETLLRIAFALARIEHGPVTAERIMAAAEIMHPERNLQPKFEALRGALRYTRRHGIRPQRHFVPTKV